MIENDNASPWAFLFLSIARFDGQDPLTGEEVGGGAE